MSVYAGMDLLSYPGRDTMKWLAENTNLYWTGFYLAPAPNQGYTGWMNEREYLKSINWGFAPVFLGQQIANKNGTNQHNLTQPQGITDAQRAVRLARQAGFPEKTVIYLDIENGGSLPQNQLDYCLSWFDEVTNNNYTPGVYCSYLQTADQIRAHRGGVVFWVFNIKTTTYPLANPFPTPHPSESGVPYALAFQMAWHHNFNAGGKNIPAIDLDSALTQDPSTPMSQTTESSQEIQTTESSEEISSGEDSAETKSRPTISKGSNSPSVFQLQQCLSKLGFDITVDGIFGPGTEAAVIQFQKDNELESDGIVGPATWEALSNQSACEEL